MKLLVGLGNPGPDYADNRHNIGFMAVDEIAKRHGFKPWRKRFEGEIAEGDIDGTRVLALKPQTYMNLSGQSVAAAARFYKIQEADTIVIYDEIDLPAAKLRVKQGGGNNGHNGLRSIDAHFGDNYWRVRLGVGRPDRAISDADPDAVARHVLRDFTKADRTWLDPMLTAVSDHIGLLLDGNENGFMNKVTLATRPPAPKKEKPPAS
jgi:PTH1 family peptidyl-tRNA hydrolase